MNRPSAGVRRSTFVSVLVMVAAFAPIVADASASAAGSGSATSPKSVTVSRDGGAARVLFHIAGAGEGLLDLSASAPGVWWGTAGAESAVVEVSVDGSYRSDLVIPSADPIRRTIALGLLVRGSHQLRITFSDHSPDAADAATLSSMSVRVASPGDADYLALSHAPILYGRDLKKDAGPFENATTDTPLVAWHETAAASTHGDSTLEYSVVWSNEDGGTSPPALMARWGRTTDIEWIYRVEVDSSGETVPGTAVYQGKNHATKRFRGESEGDHPLLQTCTSNNNVCDSKIEDPMRFALDTEQTRPPRRAREVLMDTNPWTYPIMAAEMVREGQVELPADPSTPALGDQRAYLYLECRKMTADPNDKSHWVGVSIGVVLRGDPTTVYRSDHLMPDWSIQRDLPAATTIELPAGTTSEDIARIVAIRVPVGKDTGASVTATNINRAFFLDRTYLPEASFLTWSGSATLTPQSPRATLWSA